MPGMSGLDVAAALRARFGEKLRILIISGNFHDAPRILSGEARLAAHDAFLAKPTDIRALHAALRELLGLSWVYDQASVPVAESVPSFMRRPPAEHVTDLIRLGRIGYVRGIEAKLDEITAETPEFAAYLRGLVRRFELGRYMDYLEQLDKVIG
jgi:DNA-binding NarL/FixJ family response regulator